MADKGLNLFGECASRHVNLSPQEKRTSSSGGRGSKMYKFGTIANSQGTPIEINPLSANPTKRSNALKQFVGKLLINCLNVLEHFLWLTLRGLTNIVHCQSKNFNETNGTVKVHL